MDLPIRESKPTDAVKESEEAKSKPTVAVNELKEVESKPTDAVNNPEETESKSTGEANDPEKAETSPAFNAAACNDKMKMYLSRVSECIEGAEKLFALGSEYSTLPPGTAAKNWTQHDVEVIVEYARLGSAGLGIANDYVQKVVKMQGLMGQVVRHLVEIGKLASDVQADFEERGTGDWDGLEAENVREKKREVEKIITSLGLDGVVVADEVYDDEEVSNHESVSEH
jgi:hypothetical protein